MFVNGEDSFYISNILQARFGDKIAALLEFILMMPRSNVVYVNEDKYISAVDGLLFPNGLTGDDK